MSNQNKIGIFDSGIGGLTVAKAINNLLPNEQLLYLGDTAHMPWGDKSKVHIISYATKMTEFLMHNKCKIIVIACNTASCVALTAISKKVGKIKLFNVIDPLILLLEKIKFSHIGIIGTKQTIYSETYQKKIAKILAKLNNKTSKIKTLATPILVPLIEEGLINNQATSLIIEQYLTQLNLPNNSVLILGCTHYPLIKQHIENYYQKINRQILVIDSSALIANQIKEYLNTTNQLNITPIANNKIVNTFYCTDDSEFFFKTAKLFFKNIKLDFLPLWG